MSAPAVLFVDHTGMMGGAQHSLLDIAEAHRERGAIALLEDGPFAAELEARGVRVLRIGGAQRCGASRRRAPFPAIGSLVALVRTARAVARAARPFDLLYANSPKSFLVAALAGRWRASPSSGICATSSGRGTSARPTCAP